MGTAMIAPCAHAVGHLLGTEQAGRLDTGALAVHPLGLNRVEPGTLDGQIARQDAHPLAPSLHGAVMRSDPGADGLTDVPGGVVPDQRPHGNAQRRQLGAAPVQELDGDRTEGRPWTKRSQTASACPTRRSKRP